MEDSAKLTSDIRNAVRNYLKAALKNVQLQSNIIKLNTIYKRKIMLRRVYFPNANPCVPKNPKKFINARKPKEKTEKIPTLYLTLGLPQPTINLVDHIGICVLIPGITRLAHDVCNFRAAL